MVASIGRILTTHVGSLIRPAALLKFIAAKEAGESFDEGAYRHCLKNAVTEVVKRQADIGIDIISDGEFGKAISWAQYAFFRLQGFERRPFKNAVNSFAEGRADRAKFPEFYAELDKVFKLETVADTVCVGPITYTGQSELHQDIDNFKAALGQVTVSGGFLPVAAPASVIPDRRNEYYENDQKCVEAIGKAMRTEYKAIIDAGLEVQLDDSRIANTYDRMVPPGTLKDYRKWAIKHVEILNEAIKDLPRDRIRYHVCWGSWPGPHVTDVPFKDIVDIVLKVRAGAFSIEMANPRHEHEWRVWEDVSLPEGAKLLPGVITHATNIVEHPELVSERIVRLARLVGRENVTASTDCGFSQITYYRRVHPTVQWAKLQALVEGARLASKQLWRRTPRRKSASNRSASKKAQRARGSARVAVR